MGSYINKTSKRGLGAAYVDKFMGLIADDAVEVPTPTKWEEGLVCLIDNGFMSAAGYAYDEGEMQIFLQGMDRRPHTWFLYPNAKEYAK